MYHIYLSVMYFEGFSVTFIPLEKDQIEKKRKLYYFPSCLYLSIKLNCKEAGLNFYFLNAYFFSNKIFIPVYLY